MPHKQMHAQLRRLWLRFSQPEEKAIRTGIELAWESLRQIHHPLLNQAWTDER